MVKLRNTHAREVASDYHPITALVAPRGREAAPHPPRRPTRCRADASFIASRYLAPTDSTTRLAPSKTGSRSGSTETEVLHEFGVTSAMTRTSLSSAAQALSAAAFDSVRLRSPPAFACVHPANGKRLEASEMAEAHPLWPGRAL